MAGQVGQAFPDVADVTIRQPMKEDGSAGEELPDGEVGEICYHPPLVFIGYFGQPEETAKAVSREGILYTGDMGYFKNMGTYRALYMEGRRKFMIKQIGYNVFPDEVQGHIMDHPKVALAEVVGVPHRMFDEGIFAFVQPKPGETVTVEEIMDHCQSIASYKRPQHVEIWPSDQMFLLTRMGKIDKPQMRNLALSRIEELRQAGGWDAQK
jgi:fatty-acyl-CoA synthase